MTSLKDFVLTYKSGKTLTDLDKIPVDIEIKDGSFEKNGGTVKYKYIEIDGWKYSLNSDILTQIQTTVLQRPQTKFIKVNKAPNGSLYVIPLD